MNIEHPEYLGNIECLTKQTGEVCPAFRHHAMLFKIPLPENMNTFRLKYLWMGREIEVIAQDNDGTADREFIELILN